MTNAQRRALTRAYNRGEPYFICPTPGVYAAAQTQMLKSLEAQGMITNETCPTLTDAGKSFARVILGERQKDTAHA